MYTRDEVLVRFVCYEYKFHGSYWEAVTCYQLRSCYARFTLCVKNNFGLVFGSKFEVNMVTPLVNFVCHFDHIFRHPCLQVLQQLSKFSEDDLDAAVDATDEVCS